MELLCSALCHRSCLFLVSYVMLAIGCAISRFVQYVGGVANVLCSMSTFSLTSVFVWEHVVQMFIFCGTAGWTEARTKFLSYNWNSVFVYILLSTTTPLESRYFLFAILSTFYLNQQDVKSLSYSGSPSLDDAMPKPFVSELLPEGQQPYAGWAEDHLEVSGPAG